MTDDAPIDRLTLNRNPPREPTRPAPKLSRTTFTTSRLLDFCSEKELVAQTGHDIVDWPLVIAKELFDNALDECEEAGVAPEIDIKVDETGITVTDNGRGLPAKTVKAILDYSVRVSSREAYVSPTRGAQGNALKTIVAMPFVLSRDERRGVVEISAQSKLHRIEFAVDQIRQAPAISYSVTSSERKKGTEIKVCWPVLASSELTRSKSRFLQIVDDYAWLNPHLTLRVDWLGEEQEIAATDPAWTKWKPSDPTSPHWYTPAQFERLVAAYVTHDADRKRDRTAREFVAEFRGLSGTAKQKVVFEELGLAREPLSRLVVDNRVDASLSGRLLGAMQAASKPVKPAVLGIIGKAHFEARFKEFSCEMESFEYRKVEDYDDDGLPFIVETAFAWRGEPHKNDEPTDDWDEKDWQPRQETEARRLITGVNWSPGIINPFRALGGLGRSLNSVLTEQRVGANEPVIFVLHVASPRVEYLDRGKSSVVVRS